jgi:hypothetical protein
MVKFIDRYVYSSAGRIDLSHEGFLILTDYTLRYTDIVEVSELSGGILLGEGGMGKTTFLKKLYEDAPHGSTGIFELGHYRNDPQGLRDDVRSFRESLSGGAIYIFDGYDEAPELNSLLVRLIRDLGDSAKIWVGSRDIPAIRALKDERKELETYKLAPLAERDVRDLAEADGVDTDDFIQKLREKGITHICAKPLGCEFALSAYKNNGLQLYGTRDLWRLGIRRLCDETPSGTKPLSDRKNIILDDIYKSAGWVALCLELTRNSSIWTGEESRCPDDSLPVEALVLDNLTTEVILESLLRGVFTPIGDGRVKFSQPEYQDFLSAEQFVQSIPEVAWEPLLMTRDGSGFYTDRHQITAWLTETPKFLKLLFDKQPQLLLRNETAVSKIGSDVICQRLLKHASNLSHKDTREENFSKFLFRLKTDRTAEILRYHFSSEGISDESMELAFKIIEKCSLSKLSDILIDCMSKSGSPLRVRKNASYSLANIDSKLCEHELNDLKTFDFEYDNDDDLRGNILRRLWPKYLNVSELLERITPIKKKNYLGSYCMFLDYELPMTLNYLFSDELAASVLEWANSRLLKGESSQIGNLARKIYSCYWREIGMNSRRARELLLDGYILTLKEYSNPFAIREYSEVTEPALSYDEFKNDKDTRLSMLRMVVENTEFDLNHLPNAVTTRYPLYTEDDFQDLLEFVVGAVDPILEARWFTCLNSILRLEQAVQNHDNIDRLNRAKPALIEPSETVIAELTALRSKHDTQSKEWEHEREGHERRAEESQRDIDSQIKSVLAQEEIPPNHFRGISNALCTSNGRCQRESVDLTESSGWSKLDASEREVLISLAGKYLREGDIQKSDVNSINLSTVYALHLLYSQSSDLFKQLDQFVWSRVARELVKALVFGRDQSMDVLLDALSQTAPDIACNVLVEVTAEEIESGVCSFVQRWGERLTYDQAQKLLNLCSSESVSSKGEYTLLTQIVKTSQRELSEDYLCNALDHENESPPDPAMNLHLSLAFKLMPEKYGSVIIDWLENNGVWGRQWVSNVVGSWESPLSSGVLASSVELMARYYIWLHRVYPASTCPEHDGTYTPTALDGIHELKTHLINSIINGGQVGSSEALKKIHAVFPEDEWLNNCIIIAHQSECNLSLVSLSVNEVKELVKKGEEEFRVEDVVMMEPNFCGMGIRLPQVFKWIRGKFL